MKNVLRREKGVTLIEVMIVISISIMLGAAISYILLVGGASWHSGDASVQVNQEARRGMYTMVRELRNTRAQSTIIDVPADGNFYNAVTFRTPQTVMTVSGGKTFYSPVVDAMGNIAWDNPVTYSVVNNQLRRTSGASVTVLANNVTSATFRRQASALDILEISIQTSRTTPQQRVITATLNCAVKMRN